MTSNSFLSRQEEELVAMGASIAANCTPCLRSHFAKALDAGLTLDQLKAAVAIGQAVKAAPMRQINETWQDLLETRDSPCSPTKAGCCS